MMFVKPFTSPHSRTRAFTGALGSSPGRSNPAPKLSPEPSDFQNHFCQESVSRVPLPLMLLFGNGGESGKYSLLCS